MVPIFGATLYITFTNVYFLDKNAFCKPQYTPPTPTRRNSTVASRRRCVLGITFFYIFLLTFITPMEEEEVAAAVLSCTECRELLCIACGDEHRLLEPSHGLVSLNRRSCNWHPNRQIDVFCNDCDEPGCTACRY